MKNMMKKLTAVTAAGTFLLHTYTTEISAKNEVLTDDLVSDVVLVLDMNTGEVVAERNSTERIYPASMTKMMTVLVGLEHLYDMDQTIRITDEMLAGLIEMNASTAGFAEGDMPTVRDLFYGSALPSGADASNAIAITCAGSVEAFVDLMNQKAASLGMNDTHFVNPTGLHDDEHYSTAADIAKLLQNGLKNETFREIFSTREYTTSSLYSHPSGITFASTIWSVIDAYGYLVPGMIGGKTGFTYEAGHCLAYWAKLNSMDLLVVTAKADTAMELPTHIEDASTLLCKMENWNTFHIFDTTTLLKTIHVKHMWSEEDIEIYAPESLDFDLPSESRPLTAVTFPDEVSSSRKEGRISGTVSVMLGDQVLYSSELMIKIPREPNFFARTLQAILSLIGF